MTYNRGERPDDLDFWTHFGLQVWTLDSRNLDLQGAPAGIIFGLWIWTANLDFWTSLDLDFRFRATDWALLDFWTFGLLSGAPAPIFWT